MALGKRISWIRKQYGDQAAWLALMVREDRDLFDNGILLFDGRIPGETDLFLEGMSEETERTRDEKYLWWLAEQLRAVENDKAALLRTAGILRPIWHHAVDWVLAERIDLRGMTPQQLDEGSADWHARLVEQAHDREVSQGEAERRWSDGWTMQRLGPEDLEDEGEAMGHCVGSASYEQSIIYSLRDDLGRPHVTLELDHRAVDEKWGFYVLQSKGKGNKRPVRRYHHYLSDFLMETVGPNLNRWGEALPAAPEHLVAGRLADGVVLQFKINSWRARLLSTGEAQVTVGVGALIWADSSHDLTGALEMYQVPPGSLINAMRWFLFGEQGEPWSDVATVLHSFTFDPEAPGDALGRLYDQADAMEAAWQTRLEALHLEPDAPQRQAIEAELLQAVLHVQEGL